MESLYTAKFGTGSDIKSLGWGSTYSQDTRFRILLEARGFAPTDTVLDVGCGYGDMSTLVSAYTGIDLRERAIAEAMRRYPSIDVRVQSIDEVTDTYDWVVASGIFAFDSPTWDVDTEQTLASMFRVCKKGVACNVLSSLTPNRKDPDMKYCSPSALVDLVSRVTPRFTLRHDYLPNDMTVYLYK